LDIRRDDRQAVASRHISDQLAAQNNEGIGREDQATVWLPREALQRWRDISSPAHLKDDALQAQ
jgi:hypothetical protein